MKLYSDYSKFVVSPAHLYYSPLAIPSVQGQIKLLREDDVGAEDIQDHE